MAGYIRQSSFVDGDTITAAIFNNEYNQLVNAFSNTTGHAHDGTAAEGPVIGLIGDAGETSPNNKVLIDTTNNYIEFYVEVSSAPVQQLYIADGAVVPVTDSDVDLGTSSLYFKDTYTDTVTTTGNVTVGGDLTVTGSATISGNLTFGDADTDSINLAAEIDSDIIPNTDGTYDLGSATKEWQDLYIDGTANIDSLVADTADINGGTIDGATIATSDITVGAGKTLDVSAGTLTLADDQISGDKVEGGTIAATTITTLTSTTGNVTNVNATTVDTTNIEVTNIKAKDGTAAGSIADSTGVVTLASSVLTTTDINGGTIDGTTIATSDITVGAAKTLDVSAGTLTLADNQISGDKVEGGTIAATTITDLTFGSLNDGTITVTAFVDEDDMTSDSATLIPTQQSVKAYVDSQVTAQDLDFQGDTGGALSIDLDSETLTIAGGTGLDTVGSGNTVTVNIDSTVATLTGTQTLTNKTLTSPVINTGVSGTAVLDDDTFATATATTLATSESIKAYVDTTVAATNEVVEDTTPQLGGDLDTNGNDILFADSDKAIFGAGSDLEIYHTSADNSSYIRELGAGNLKILGDNVQIMNAAGTENQIFSASDSGVVLYHNGVAKFETTATGIDVTGVITTDGLTTSADINFGDNDKAVFGAGSDLQIYHDGTHSYLLESNATGNLYLGGDNLFLTNANATKVYVKGIDGGATELRHNNSAKLATTSTGIDVTGTATMDGLTVDGDTTFNTSSDGSFVDFSKNNTTVGSIGTATGTTYIDGGSTFAGLQFGGDGGSEGRVAPRRNGSLDDGGTTLGTSSYRFKDLYLSGFAFVGTQVAPVNGTATTPAYGFSSDSNTGMYNVGANILGFSTDGSERLRIDSSGNVGIGTSSPSAKLAIETGIDEGIRLFRTSANANFGAIEFRNSTDTATNSRIGWNNNELRLEATSVISATTNGSEAMRIDSSGNVGIGTSSPASILEISKNDQTNGATLSITNSFEGGSWTAGDTVGTVDFRVDDGSTTQKVRGQIKVFDDTSVSTTYPAYNAMSFSTGLDNTLNERMRIDSSGNVGIGTSSPAVKLAVSNNGAEGIELVPSGGGEPVIQSYNRSGSAFTPIRLTASDLKFHTGSSPSEAMRIDSSGNLLVDKTAIDLNTVGFEVRPNGIMASTRDGGSSAYFNRKTSDGSVVEFNKDGTAVGSIGTVLDDLNIYPAAVGHKGLRFGNGYIGPTGNSTTLEDATTNLGLSGSRFKDLYLSGVAKVDSSAYISQGALTSSSNAVAWDAAAKANAYYATTENTTFSAPSNAVEGAIISVEIAQGGTPYTVAWNTVFEFAASTAPTVTATANKTDIFSFRYNGSVWQEIGRTQNMAQT